MKYVPGGHATFFGFLNSFVHVPMYAYYFLSAMGPQMQRYLSWKKYLTAFQMVWEERFTSFFCTHVTRFFTWLSQVQFVAIFAHSFQLFFRSCDFPKAFGLWIGAHGVLFWFLFSNFYKSAYSKTGSFQKNRHHISCHTNGDVIHQQDCNNNLNKKALWGALYDRTHPRHFWHFITHFVTCVIFLLLISEVHISQA